MSGRVDVTLVCGGRYHDFDFARLELLRLLGEDVRLRTRVLADFEGVLHEPRPDVLVSYTCDVRPSEATQAGLRDWVRAGGRWLALHGTNAAFDPPADLAAMGAGAVFGTPRCFPDFADVLGSQFLSHPPIAPYRVTVSPGAEHDPLVTGIEPFDATDELYLCEYHGDVEPLLETRWTGTTSGFAEAEWPDDEPRLVMYRRPLGDGAVLYLTLGHCRSHWDMVDPPFNGARYPQVERGSWELGDFYELLRRGISWAAAPARARSDDG